MLSPMPILIGHRGLPSLAPENTKASITAAHLHNIEWIEVDVTMAGDGSLVIMHDDDLSLFGLPKNKLVEMKKSQLLQVDAGTWFSQEFKGEPLLFLTHLLVLVKDLNLGLNLELKINPDIDVDTQIHALAIALTFNPVPAEKFVLSSFNHTALNQLRRLNPELKLAPLFDDLPEQIPESMIKLKPVSVHCNHQNLTKRQTEVFTKRFPLYCYTVNDANRLLELLNWGVSGIFCDHAHSPEMRAAATV